MSALDRINAMDAGRFGETFGALYEHSPWAAQRAFAARPFGSLDDVFVALAAAVNAASADEHMALIRAHPVLAGAAVRARSLTAASLDEQAGAGLDRLDPEEAAQFDALNQRYAEAFGFPFIICVRLHTKDEILAAMSRRLDRDTHSETAEALRQIETIARLRFNDVIARLGAAP